MSPVIVNAKDFQNFESLVDAFRDFASKHPHHHLYHQPRSSSSEASPPSREWDTIRCEQSLERVERIAGFLSSVGVKGGVRVTILSNTRPEWREAELGTYLAGGTVVTAYATDSAERNGYIMFDSDSRIVFVENQEQLDKVVSICRQPFACPGTETRQPCATTLDLLHVIAFEQVDVPEDFTGRVTQLSDILTGRARSLSSQRDGELPRREDEATIVYTSGTSGAPKGVVATHAQHLENIRQIIESGLTDDIDDVLHVLPLAHGFGLRMGHLTACTGVEGIFPAIPDAKSSELNARARASLAQDMREAHAQVIPAVPRMLEKMRDGVLAKISSMSPIKRALVTTFLDTYSRVYEESEGGPKTNPGTKLLHALFELPPLRLGPRLQKSIRSQIAGDYFKFFVSGGAALPKGVAVFFGAIGMPAFEGYGSTETNVPVTVNTRDNHRLGSVGRRLTSDIELKISDEGELLVKGPNNSVGYLGRESATRERWEDGWYHTRDAAQIDRDGYLFLKGRVDDVMKTTTGEFIQPAPIEERMKGSRFVSEAVLFGGGRSCCVALVTLNEAAVHQWALLTGYTLQGNPVDDPEVQNLVRQDVMSVTNQATDRKYEWVRNVGVIPELSVGCGLTPTFKVQRAKVSEMHAELIDRLYVELD